MKKVWVTIQSLVHEHVHKRIVENIVMMKGYGDYDVKLDQTVRDPSAMNGQRLLWSFLGQKDMDFWINIDADNPPVKNPLDLIDLDLDIVGCPTPMWKNTSNIKIRKFPIVWNVFVESPMSPDQYIAVSKGNGLVEIAAVGFGCIVIARRVCEGIWETNPFVRPFSQDGTPGYSADISFSRFAKEGGFKIWAHFDYVCRHYKLLDLLEIAQAMTSWRDNGNSQDRLGGVDYDEVFKQS